LDPSSNAASYLCFYYCSPFSAYPVRNVNRIVPVGRGGFVADCKVDPNWETGTFGLFSTCQASIRAGVVSRHSPYLFFFGDHATEAAERGVTGYYRLRWYADGGTYERDYCLAADKTHFVKRAISFAAVNRQIGTRLSNRVPRLALMLNPKQAAGLISMLEAQPDATTDYIAEVRRLEELNARSTGGFRYVNFRRRESYSWSSVRNIKGLGGVSGRRRQRNSGPHNAWRCSACEETVRSRSLLKLCPACQSHGTLEVI
jgi:hypothetical protein